MATEIMTPLGELHEFDPFIQKMKEEAAGQQPQHNELLSSSALSKIGLKFEGTTYEVARVSDAKQTPFAKYSETSKKSVQAMRVAQTIIEDEIDKIQSSLPDEDHYSSTNASIRQLSAKLKDLESRIEEYDLEEEAAYSELTVLQKSLQEKQRVIFESKEKEYDRQIAEVRALGDEYNAQINQDEALLENNKLADAAFSIAEDLRSIIEENGSNRDSMMNAFAPKFDELLSELQRSSSERFFEETQMIILQNVTGIIQGNTQSIDRDGFYKAMDDLVKRDYVKVEAALSSLDVDNEIHMISLEKELFVQNGAANLVNDDIGKIQSDIAELESSINAEERAGMEKEKSALSKRIEELQAKLDSDTAKLSEGQALIEKLNEFGVDSIIHKLNHLDFDSEEISDLDESALHLSEPTKLRETLIQSRGAIASMLKDIDLHMDDSESTIAFRLSVDIAASSDVDGLLILKSNFLKEKSRNLLRISHIESQIRKVDEALGNIRTVTKYLQDAELLASEMKIEHKAIGELDALKKDLLKTSVVLNKKKHNMLKLSGDYKVKADHADDRIEEVNQKILAFDGFDEYASAEDLKGNYRIHINVLKTIQFLIDSLVEFNKDLKARKQIEISNIEYEEEIADSPEEEVFDDEAGESLAGIFDDEQDGDDLNTSLADELAKLGESTFINEVPATSTPAAKPKKPVSKHKRSQTVHFTIVGTEEQINTGEAALLDMSKPEEAAKAKEFKQKSGILPKLKGLFGKKSPAKSTSTLESIAEFKATALPASSGVSTGNIAVSSASMAAPSVEMQASALPKSKGVARTASVKSTASMHTTSDELQATALPASSGVSTGNIAVSSASVAAPSVDMQASGLPKSKGVTRTASVKSAASIHTASDELQATALPTSSGVSAGNIAVSSASVAAPSVDMQASELPKSKGVTRSASVKSAASMHTASDELHATALPASTGMDFASVMNLLEEAPAQQVAGQNTAAESIPKAKATQVSTPIVGKAVAAPMSQVESGALALDEGNVHASNPHVEGRGFMPRHIDSGPTYSSKVYNLLATTINKSHANESAASHKPVSGVHVEAVKPKTAELLGNMLTKQAGLEGKKLSPVGMSNVDGKALDRLIARGEKPGSLLLWAMRQNMEVGLADLLNHIQVH